MGGLRLIAGWGRELDKRAGMCCSDRAGGTAARNSGMGVCNLKRFHDPFMVTVHDRVTFVFSFPPKLKW